MKRTVLESLVGPSKSGASAKTIAHNANGKAKKRVAILGGSFNPITDGHLKMAAEVIHARAADEVWINHVAVGRTNPPNVRSGPFLDVPLSGKHDI